MTDDDLDAWVLASVAFGERPATIAQIVSTGDYLNHAVLSQAELACGLARLAARGLVKRERDRVVATKAGARLYRSARNWMRELPSSLGAMDATASEADAAKWAAWVKKSS